MNIEELRKLNSLNTFRVSAIASYYIKVTTEVELVEALAFGEAKSLPIQIIGEGSNLLFVNDFPGLVVHIANKGIFWSEEINHDCRRVTVAAGENWHSFVTLSLAKGLYGLENLALIPGTVGAAPIQNIGAYGAEIKDSIIEVKLFDRLRQKWRIFSNQECEFAYRDSVFKRANPNPYVVFNLTLELTTNWCPNLVHEDLSLEFSNKATVAKDVFNKICDIRKRKLPDPKLLGNAGSFFKNPLVSHEKLNELESRFPDIPSFAAEHPGLVKVSAAWLLDKAGWRGKARGGAAVHDNHALILVNSGNATGEDIMLLSQDMSNSILEKYGIVLEPEVRII